MSSSSPASHMAQFVAAVLRDKTMEELMDQIEQQQCFIKKVMKVEITGPGGSPVYAEGQFDEGDFGNDINHWCPKITAKEGVECPLQNLRGVEVRLGGVVQFTMHDQTTMFGMMPMHEGTKSIHIKVDDGSALGVTMKGCEDRHYEQIVEMQPNWWEALSASVALERLDLLPGGCTVNFRCLWFCAQDYQTLMSEVPLSKEQKERCQDQPQQREDKEAISQRMREEAPNLDQDYYDVIHWQLENMKILRISDELELVLPHLLELYKLYQEAEMGVPDLLFEIMQEAALSNLDILNGLYSDDREEHLELLERFVVVLQRLKQQLRDGRENGEQQEEGDGGQREDD